MQNTIKSCCFNWVKASYSPPTWAALVAGVFVVVSLILSVYLLFEHLSSYKHPEEQKFLIGVILMVPCYAVESFVSLLDPSISVDVEILRDGYESFAMYCFGRYLVACLVLGYYVGDYPVDPDEVRDSERPTKLSIPQPEVNVRSGTTIKESVKDVFVGGGEFIVNDVKFTVTQAVEPMEKGILHINKKLHKISQNIKKHDKERRTKDDSYISSPSHTVIRGIDDPLLNSSMSDTGTVRKKRHRRKSGYKSAESGGEGSSDHSFGGYQIRGRRWITKD